jgi:hypothetical protein
VRVIGHSVVPNVVCVCVFVMGGEGDAVNVGPTCLLTLLFTRFFISSHNDYRHSRFVAFTWLVLWEQACVVTELQTVESGV